MTNNDGDDDDDNGDDGDDDDDDDDESIQSLTISVLCPSWMSLDLIRSMFGRESTLMGERVHLKKQCLKAFVKLKPVKLWDKFY